MYKYRNNLLPQAFNNMFTCNVDNHSYNTRHASDFEYPGNRLEFGKKSICYHGVKVWNNIPNHVKDASNIKSFKSSYRNTFISNYKDIE